MFLYCSCVLTLVNVICFFGIRYSGAYIPDISKRPKLELNVSWGVPQEEGKIIG